MAPQTSVLEAVSFGPQTADGLPVHRSVSTVPLNSGDALAGMLGSQPASLNLGAGLDAPLAEVPILPEPVKRSMQQDDILAMGAGTRAVNDMLNPKSEYESQLSWGRTAIKHAARAFVRRVFGPSR